MQRKTGEEKAALLNEWRARGVAAKDFCAEKGLNYSAFMKWKRSEEESTPGHPAFIEVTKRGSSSVAAGGSAQAFLRLQHSGVAIEIHGAVDPGYVASVLAAVGGR